MRTPRLGCSECHEACGASDSIVAQSWELTDGMPAVFTVTNQLDGWGTQNNGLTDPARVGARYVLPGPAQVGALREGYDSFRIRFPALGDHEVTLFGDTLSYIVESPAASRRVLVIAPHEDDEALACSGVIHRSTGQATGLAELQALGRPASE